MNSVVIYASRYGNTREDCGGHRRWAAAFGTAQLFAAEKAPTPLPQGTDLIVIGGPTEMHKMTEPLAEVLRRIEPETLHGVAAAAFRHTPALATLACWLGGSRRLEQAPERGRADDRANGELLCQERRRRGEGQGADAGTWRVGTRHTMGRCARRAGAIRASRDFTLAPLPHI